MLRLSWGALLALLPATAVVAQDTVVWEKDVQGWAVIVDRTINSSCFIISEFADDLYLRLQFNTTQDNVQFILANMRWDALETGREYDLEVAFGSHASWDGAASGYRWHDVLPSLVFSVPVADNQAYHFMREFMGIGSVSVSFDGEEIATAALAGADRAVASMMECQATMFEASGNVMPSDFLTNNAGNI
jgi:hypothetical protein